MRHLSPGDASRRARAAIGYAGLEHGELEQKTGIATGTLRRITSRTNPRRTSLEELWAIADACGVPRSFMEEGFGDAAPAPDERLEAVEHQLQTVSRQVRDLAERLRPIEERLDVTPPREEKAEERLAEDVLPAPEGALGRDLGADKPKTRSQEQKRTQPGQGAR